MRAEQVMMFLDALVMLGFHLSKVNLLLRREQSGDLGISLRQTIQNPPQGLVPDDLQISPGLFD